MKFLKNNLLKSLIIFALPAIIFSCTYTKTFPPKLSSKGDTVINKIKNANSFEDIELQEKQTSGSKGDLTVLTVKLYNGKNLPADSSAVRKLGKEIASQIKPVLTDAGGINSYIVLFCTRTVDGNTTNTTYNGYEYQSGEL
jgi:hypothetical protein